MLTMSKLSEHYRGIPQEKKTYRKSPLLSETCQKA